ncbi:MAG: hypothetical protein JXR95_05690 [Deltaproteobacteria bacterium]|nr:hypothetical protein [Deltaproteobacteria bacterium]
MTSGKQYLKKSSDLKSGVLSLLEPPSNKSIFYRGPDFLKKHLILKGYSVTDSFSLDTGTVILFKVLSEKNIDTLKYIKDITEVKQSICLISIDQSISREGNLTIFNRLMNYFRFSIPAYKISFYFLREGFSDISQKWPQGLGSLVITRGYTLTQ